MCNKKNMNIDKHKFYKQNHWKKQERNQHHYINKNQNLPIIHINSINLIKLINILISIQEVIKNWGLIENRNSIYYNKVIKYIMIN